MTTYTYRGVDDDTPGIGRRLPAKCGTDGGYYRHRRITKTPACEDCRTAHATAERVGAARRRLRETS